MNYLVLSDERYEPLSEQIRKICMSTLYLTNIMTAMNLKGCYVSVKISYMYLFSVPARNSYKFFKSVKLFVPIASHA